MTHDSETGAINRFHFVFLAPVSATCVIQIWDRIHLVPDSGADYYSNPEGGVHATKNYCTKVIINIVRKSQFYVSPVQRQNIESLDAFLFGTRRNFHPECIWHEKPAPENVADFLAPVYRLCAMGIKPCQHCHRKRRLSPNSVTVPFSATVVVFGDKLLS